MSECIREMVLDEAWRQGPNASEAWPAGFVYGAEWGAGWAFAIVGMAERFGSGTGATTASALGASYRDAPNVSRKVQFRKQEAVLIV